MQPILKPLIARALLTWPGALALAALAAPLPAHAAGEAAVSQAAASASASADMTDGEVRRIDLDGGKITLKHAEIKNLDMPSMTMVFVVKDKALLGTLKPGDKVKFKAAKDAGQFTVTEIRVEP